MTSYYLLALTSVQLSFWVSVVSAECGPSYFACHSSGDCVKWRFYCDGRCHCVPDCSDEDPRRGCHAPGRQNAESFKDSPTSIMSGAMVGVVIACLAMLFLLVAAVIFFLVCRRRLFAAKPTQSRRPVADARALQESGCGLPVDIPVEALSREPPPRYSSEVDLSTSSSTSYHRDQSISVLPPPPPYSAQTPARCDDTLTMPPFNLDESRRSVSGIILHTSSPRVAPRAGSASAGRLRSVDISFTEYPNMSDVLLTSSKSSLPTSSDSAAAAAMVASPRSRRSDSARGDSIDSWPSSAEHGSHRSSGDLPERSCSLTDVAVAHGGSRQSVPDSELQRQARHRDAAAAPPHTASLDHGVSMDPGAGQHRRRRTGAGTSASEQRHHRRQSDEQRAARRHKSRSLTQMTTVDEEQATTAAARLDAPAFAGSAV